MVFFVLLSKLPIINVSSPDDLVKQNKVTLGLGLAIYGILGGLILWGKLPLDKWLSFIPDKKYLMGIIFLDLILYFLLYRFEYGFFPPSSLESIPLPPPLPQQSRIKRKPKSNQNGGGKPVEIKQQHQKQTPAPKNDLVDDEISSLSTNLHDDIDSTFKKPINLEVPPEDASLTGQNYFKDSDQAVIENWDLDEFTQEEYVPDKMEIDQAGSMDDEMIIEGEMHSPF